jgi:hypothetical protein
MNETAQAQINCPRCGTLVDVSKVLYDKLQTEIGQQYERTMELEREKNLELVISNKVQMYGSIKDIEGVAMAKVQSLELPAADPTL